MDAPLQDYTIEEQRGVVRLIWAGAKTVEIHRRMLAQYGQSTMSHQKVYEWVERFNLVEHVLLMKVVLVSHQYRAHKTTRAAEKLLLRRNTETS